MSHLLRIHTLFRPPRTFYKPLHPLWAFLTCYKTPPPTTSLPYLLQDRPEPSTNLSTPLRTTTDLLFSFADRCTLVPPAASLPPLVTRPLHLLQASFDPSTPLADRYKTPSTRYESFPPVTSFFRPSTTFVDALHYTIWQIYIGKSIIVRRSGARDLTLRLWIILITILSSRPLNTYITSLQMTTCGNNTKKILQTLQK